MEAKAWKCNPSGRRLIPEVLTVILSTLGKGRRQGGRKERNYVEESREGFFCLFLPLPPIPSFK
jgi:hypothetical protein